MELKEQKFLTRKEAAAYLRISGTLMYDIMRAPDFPALVRFGKRRILIDREKLDGYIESRTGSYKETL